jgi:hypothetical protein
MLEQQIVDHHEALRMSRLCICYVFCFCDVLLFASEECCFSFFMVAMTLGIDQRNIF